MCGICGWIEPSGLDFPSLVRMNRLASHRGPDGEGFWLWGGGRPEGQFVESRSADAGPRLATVGLGHRRLAILDLSEAGLQPMPSGDSQLWVVFNGEIYNYLELKAELARLGHRFRTGTDTEVILAAYERWGVECFARFNGMWGIAIADLRRRVLVLSRDRLGIKPLYVWAGGGSLAFASEIKQFFALPCVAPAANMNAIAEYVDTGYEGPPETFFDGIQAFPPGCWGEVSLDRPARPEPQSFWFPERIAASGAGRAEAEEQIRHLFGDAVKLQLRSDVPVGVCLSGGLDSSAVYGQVQLLRNGTGARTAAFSAAFDEARFDERRYIKEVLARHGGEGHYTFPTAEEFLGDFDDFIYHHDEPPGSLSQYAAWSVMRLSRGRGVPVLLNGQGGDELFSGYWPAYYTFLRRQLSSSPPRVMGHLLWALLPGGNPALVGQLIPHFRQYRGRKGRNNRGLLLPHFRACGFTLEGNWATRAQQVNEQQFRLHEVRRIHLPRLLKWDDRNSMAFSIEGRYPFHDHRFVELALGLQTELNLGRGWNKLLIRGALGHLLPPSIRWRRSKMGFVTPQSVWIRTTLRPKLQAWVARPSERLQQIVDPAGLRRLAEGLLGSTRDQRMDEGQLLLVRLFFLDRWLNRFGVELRPEGRPQAMSVSL